MQPLEFMSMSYRKRQSIWIISWRDFKPKGKEFKVKTIMLIKIEIVTGNGEMSTERREIGTFHLADEM